MKIKVKTKLKSIRKYAWKNDLSELYSINGKRFNNRQVHDMIDLGIEKGYEYDTDIPDNEAKKFLGI